MTQNDLVLLDGFLDGWKSNAPSHLSDDVLFELFAGEQLLKPYDVSTDDVLAGIVGGNGDGGIDGFFTLVNGDLVDADTDLSEQKRDPIVDLIILQAKRSTSFEQVVFDRATATIRKLLDLSIDESELLKTLSPQLVERAGIFRRTMKELVTRHPAYRVTFCYATRGDTGKIDPTVVEKGHELEAAVREHVPGTGNQCTASFMGARELLDEARKQPSYTLSLTFIESPITIQDSYIVLVNLKDFAAFISDESGNRREYVFEANVRDYQGDVEVNKDISRALLEGEPPDFWWLNNGVTILASRASISGKVLALEDVQIVNGLQTSVRVQEFVAAHPERTEQRSILCRVVVTQDAKIRDRIIKATNFQTAVSPASLRATDVVQHDLESHFHANDWYYDRRKNYHKNVGRPADKIVSIAYLAQAMTAIGLSRPDDARARPTTLIKKDEDYQKIFDNSVPLPTYLWAAKVLKHVDSFTRQDSTSATSSMMREFRFHLAMWLVFRRLGARSYHPNQLNGLSGTAFTDGEIEEAWAELMQLIQSHPDFNTRALDVLAKSREVVQWLFEQATTTPPSDADPPSEPA